MVRVTVDPTKETSYIEGSEPEEDKPEEVEMGREYGRTPEGSDDEALVVENNVELLNQSFYMDGYLKTNLDLLKTKIRDDWDFVMVIDGIEGSGKSVLAQQIAYYVSNGKLSLKNVVFDSDSFRTAVIGAEKYDAIIFDEAFAGMASRAAMSQTNKTIVSMLQQIRQKNLFIFLVLPSIWDLDKYAAIHRCRGLIHVYTSKTLARGYFSFFKKSQVVFMFANDKKFRYRYPQAVTFRGRFTNYYTLEKEEYKTKKLDSLKAFENKRESGDVPVVISHVRFNKAINYLNICTEIIKQAYPGQLKAVLAKKGINYQDFLDVRTRETKSTQNPEDSGGFDGIY